jgi:hypothetical protein
MADRLYIATPANGGPARLVMAASPAQTYAHLAHQTWDVAPAKPMDVAEAMQAGAKIEQATPGQQALPLGAAAVPSAPPLPEISGG